MQAQARAIGPRRGPRFRAQVPAGPRVSAEINQRVRCADNSSRIQLSATTRPCRPSRASKDPQRHAIEQMPRRGREGRRRHIGGGPGVGPGGRVRRSRSTSITLIVVVARILGRVERDWPGRAEFVGTRAGGETAESHMVATASPKLWMYPEAAEPSAYLQPIVVFVGRSAKFALARSSSLFAVGRREGRVVLQERLILRSPKSNLRTFKTKQPLVPGYAFIHRRRVLSVFLGKGRGRAEENGSRRWRSLSSL